MRDCFHRAGLLGALLCAGALGGCFSSRPPRLEVEGVRAGEIAGGRRVVLIDVVAHNPNREALPLREIQYQLSLENEPAFEGLRDAQATIRGYGVQRLTLPAPVDASRVAPGSTAFRVSGRLTYVAPEVLAQTIFDNKIHEWSAGLKGEGVVAGK